MKFKKSEKPTFKKLFAAARKTKAYKEERAELEAELEAEEVMEAAEEDQEEDLEVMEAAPEQEADYAEALEEATEEKPKKKAKTREEDKNPIAVKRINFTDIDDDLTYGVLMDNAALRKGFGSQFYPAKGWEIKKAGASNFDYGAVKALLSNSRFWPKGTFLAHHSSWPENVYIAICYWKGESYTSPKREEGYKPVFVHIRGRWMFPVKTKKPVKRKAVLPKPKPRLKFSKKKKKLAIKFKRH